LLHSKALQVLVTHVETTPVSAPFGITVLLLAGVAAAHGVHEELMDDSEIYADIYYSQLIGDTDFEDIAAQGQEPVLEPAPAPRMAGPAPKMAGPAPKMAGPAPKTAEEVA